MTLLELRGMGRRFPGVVALDAVDLDLQAGEVHVVAGENGAGKSTLMRIVAGADAPDEGTLALDGTPVTLRGPRDALARGVAAVYQEGTLAPHLSVAENVALGHEPAGRFGVLDRERMREDARRAIAELGATIDPDAPVGSLGVAARQVVEVARALARGGKILVLDEPTAPLTEREVPALHEAVRRLTAKGVGVLYVSHRLEEFAAIGDRVTVLRNGKKVWTRPIAQASVDRIVAAMAGEAAEAPASPVPAARSGDVRLEVDGLSAGPIQGARFTVRAGEVVGVAGLVGSGRSTLLHAIFGAIPHAGTIRIDGRAVWIRSPADAIAAGVGLVPEDRKHDGLALGLPITTNVTLASLERFGGLAVDAARERTEVEALAKTLSIKHRDLGQPVGELSGGNQQKVLLARWLCRDAKVLLLDEPAAGVDVGARAELYREVAALAAAGNAVLLVASYLPELLAASDRVLVLHRGRIVAELARHEARPERVLALMSTGAS